MTTRAITIAGFGIVFVLAAALVIAALIRRDRLGSFSEVIAHLSRRRITRIVILAIWAWLGWHFLAR